MHTNIRGAWWLSGSYSVRLETEGTLKNDGSLVRDLPGNCAVPLYRTLYPGLYWFTPRNTGNRPNMTQNLLTWA